MDFLNAENIGLTLTAIGVVVNAVALIFVWKQLRQNHRLERASFTNTLNSELNNFVDVRVFLKEHDTKVKISEVKTETYERVLDYFTAFENIRWMIHLNVLSLEEAKDYFGGRFYEAFNSVFFQTKCNEDESFKLMYKMMFELHDNFENTPLAIGYAKPTIISKKKLKQKRQQR